MVLMNNVKASEKYTSKKMSGGNAYTVQRPSVIGSLSPKIDLDFLKEYDIFREPISLMLDKK